MERVQTAFANLSANSQESELFRLRAMVDQVPDYLFVKNRRSQFIVANKAVAIDNGFSDPRELVGKTDFDIHPHENAVALFAAEQEIMRSAQPHIDMEEHLPNIGEKGKWVLTSKLPMRDRQGEVIGLVGIARDITERKRADAQRAGQARLLEMIATGSALSDVLNGLLHEVESFLDDASASVLLIDELDRCLRFGAAPSLPPGYCAAVDGLPIGPNAGACGTAAFRKQSVIIEDTATDPLWDAYRHLAGSDTLRSCWAIPIQTQGGTVLGILVVYSMHMCQPNAAELELIDMAASIAAIAIERKRYEDRIQFMAHHDVLTDLPNRAVLDGCIASAIDRAERDDRWAILAFVDLDRFKQVNDTYGHSAGDDLLRTVAKRLKNCLRSSDTAVRLGGDEFLLLLADHPKSVDVALSTVHRIQTALKSEIMLSGEKYTLSCSIGVAICPQDGTDAETLIANADQAMYEVKQAGGNGFRLFRPDPENPKAKGDADRPGVNG